MPIYSYRCSVCNKSEEVIASMTQERPAPVCCDAAMDRDYARDMGSVTPRSENMQDRLLARPRSWSEASGGGSASTS